MKPPIPLVILQKVTVACYHPVTQYPYPSVRTLPLRSFSSRWYSSSVPYVVSNGSLYLLNVHRYSSPKSFTFNASITIPKPPPHRSITTAIISPPPTTPSMVSSFTVSSSSSSSLPRTSAALDLRHPASWYTYTRSFPRTIILHVGPTNSGKTYAALTALQNARNGIYAGPLRLLAWEIYERLNTQQNIPCNLLTGQEYETVPNANHISATVEMVDTLMNTTVAPLDVLVLDEIQMIGDRDRGWAWTRVLLGAPVKEIHACGDPTVVPLIRRLIGQTTQDKLIVKEYDRLSPLLMHPTPVRSWHELQRGDVVVAFGRKQLYEHKRQIERSTGLRVGLVYGSLPPTVRREQAQKFNYQETVKKEEIDKNVSSVEREGMNGNGITSATATDILCASDAIGMGLNLAIRRIIFTKIRKFDGIKHRELTISEIKQISGRAGRYKSLYPEGYVTGMTVTDSQTIATALQSVSPPIRTAGLLPLMDQLIMYALSFAPYEWFEEYGYRPGKEGKGKKDEETVTVLAHEEEIGKDNENGDDDDGDDDTLTLLEYSGDRETELGKGRVGNHGYGGRMEPNEENFANSVTMRMGMKTDRANEATVGLSPTVRADEAASGSFVPRSSFLHPLPPFQGIPNPILPSVPSFTWASSITLADRVVHYLVPYSKLLELFETHAQLDKQSYFLCSMEDLIRVARLLDDIPLPFRIRYTFCQAPVDIEDEMVVRALRRYARNFLRDGQVPVKDNGGKKYRMENKNVEKRTNESTVLFGLGESLSFTGSGTIDGNSSSSSTLETMNIPTTAEELARMESLHATMDLYQWLARKFSSEFTDSKEAVRIAQQTEQLISQGISKMGDNHVAYARQQLRKRTPPSTSSATTTTMRMNHDRFRLRTAEEESRTMMMIDEDPDMEVNDTVLYQIMDRARKGKRKGKGIRKERSNGNDRERMYDRGSMHSPVTSGKENRSTKKRKGRSVSVEEINDWIRLQKRKQEQEKEELRIMKLLRQTTVGRKNTNKQDRKQKTKKGEEDTMEQKRERIKEGGSNENFR